MTYTIKTYSSLCSLETFIINDIEADKDDFIVQYDHDQANAEGHGCGDMQAEIKDVEASILKKYNITEDMYRTIAEDVAEKVSFGCCGLCT